MGCQIAQLTPISIPASLRDTFSLISLHDHPETSCFPRSMTILTSHDGAACLFSLYRRTPNSSRGMLSRAEQISETKLSLWALHRFVGRLSPHNPEYFFHGHEGGWTEWYSEFRAVYFPHHLRNVKKKNPPCANWGISIIWYLVMIPQRGAITLLISHDFVVYLNRLSLARARVKQQGRRRKNGERPQGIAVEKSIHICPLEIKWVNYAVTWVFPIGLNLNLLLNGSPGRAAWRAHSIQ